MSDSAIWHESRSNPRAIGVFEDYSNEEFKLRLGVHNGLNGTGEKHFREALQLHD